MEENNEPGGSTSKPDINAEDKKNQVSRTAGIGTAVFLFVCGFVALLGWWRLEFTPIRVVLYVIAVLSISLGSFGLVETLTAKSKPDYSIAAMLFTWFAFLMYASSLADVDAPRWTYLGFAVFFGLVALIALIVQGSKDIRQQPSIRWVIALLLILGLPVLLTWHFERPVILCLIPFTLIVLYHEYLRNTYLNKPTAKVQSAQDVSHKKPDLVAPFRSLPGALRSVRAPAYLILVTFSGLFYLMILPQTTQAYDFGLFFQAVAPAYLGILAIVIAFAVLVIRREAQQEIGMHFRLAITGLVQMYVVFALVTAVGLLIGTDVSGDFVMTSMKLSEIVKSVDSILNVCRLLILQFAVSAFPVGLLYLYAMIRDFMTP